MKLITFYFLVFSFFSWSQETANTMEKQFEIGETTINIYEENRSIDGNIIFLNVHQDEKTSIDALHAYTILHPIHFFYLKHLNTRRIAFDLDGKKFDFDPNRIFTKKGRKKTLKDGTNYSRKANRAVKKLAEEIISRIPLNSTVIAVHNNTDTNYSIKSYDVGGDEAQNTAALYINPKMDADDFIYTTDKTFFEAFKAKKINVILQDNKGYVNDGSLSVYCGKNGIPYINIETEKGHYNQQLKLIADVIDCLQHPK